MESKRGFSVILAVVILFVFAFLVFGSIFVMNNDFANGEEKQTQLGSVNINLDLENAILDGNTINAVVKRNEGSGDLIAINFILEDGTSVGIIKKETTLAENQTEVFVLDLNEISLENAIAISVAPIYKLDDGEEVTGSSSSRISFVDFN